MQRLVLLLLSVLTPLSQAMFLECHFVDGRYQVTILVTYPESAKKEYKVNLTAYDLLDLKWDSSMEMKLTGKGRLDQRYVGGELEIFEAESTDSFGTITFVEPETQKLDPKTGEVLGRVRRLKFATGIEKNLLGCSLRHRPGS